MTVPAAVPKEMLIELLAVAEDTDDGDEIAGGFVAAIKRLQHLEQLAERMTDGWMPIDTVPLDRVVLLCDARGNRWTDVGHLDGDLYIYNSCGWAPTHWRDMPSPPNPLIASLGEGK
jgi:hypothetical protein